MKRAFCLFLVLMLLLAATGCAGKKPEEDTTDPREDLMSGVTTEAQKPETTPETKPEEKPDEQDAQPPQDEPKPEEDQPEEVETSSETENEDEQEAESTVEMNVPPPLTNPLSGEVVETDFAPYRPFAVMVGNVRDAVPQEGLSRAEILYEATVEGVSRCMAVYQNFGATEKVGGVRSCRSWFVDLALAYDAFYMHKGASEEGDARIRETRVLDVNPYIAGWFYRDDWRSANLGYVHSLTADVPLILSQMEEKGYDIYHPEGYSYGLTFAADPALPETAEDALKIELCLNSKNTNFEYDAENRQYLAFEFGAPWVDHAFDNCQLSFRNILALNVRTHYVGVYCKHDLTGEGTGVWFIDGKAVPITWSREKLSDPFSYFLEDGTPLTLGVGHTYIGLIGSTGWIEYTAGSEEAAAE